MSTSADLMLARNKAAPTRVYLSTRANAAVGAGDLQVAPIKGNQGNQNYLLLAGTDVSRYRSVVIWCERFSVGLGHPELKA